MMILAVDTALGQESCAILKDGRILAFSQGTENSLQAEKLFEHINKVLNQAKLKFEDMDYFAADLGPGSFTGIRIGLAAILGICFAQDKKFVGVSSLEALAYKSKITENRIGESKNIHAVLNAGRDEIYSQKFELDKDMLKIMSLGELVALNSVNHADIGNLPFCSIQAVPDAKDIAMATYRMIKNNIADFSRKAPIYIRQPDAKVSAGASI